MATRNGPKTRTRTTPAPAIRKPATMSGKAIQPKPKRTPPSPAQQTVRPPVPAAAVPPGEAPPCPVFAPADHAEEVVLVLCTEVEVQNVTVAGTFNNWNPTENPLHRISPKTYAAKLKLAPGEYQYKFVVDGVWIEDPTARKCVPDGHDAYNSVLLV